MADYKKPILNALLDKYEEGKSRVRIEPARVFPGYTDHAKYELYRDVNSSALSLQLEGFVSIQYNKDKSIKFITVQDEKIDAIYALLKRTSKASINGELSSIYDSLYGKSSCLDLYIDSQRARMLNNQSVEYFKGDIKTYESFLNVVLAAESVPEETFERDFSVRTLGDSKAFGLIKVSVAALLFKYGDFASKESIFEELNIIKNPGHVYFKGAGNLVINGQRIQLESIPGDIAISSLALTSIEHIEVTGSKVISIENLTTFNRYRDDDALIIYLGGYHNSVRRAFIKRLYSENPNKDYFHYGDIDSGGFYILKHLRSKTGVHFKPLNMDRQTLCQYKEYTKRLTESDKSRLIKLLGGEFDETINYMLENDCKLEQEALD